MGTVIKRYRITGGRANRTYLHRARAEAALGKSLPPDAVVHHADGSKTDDAPLVICQNERYHRLLHARMRVKVAGGDPNHAKVCSGCKQVKWKSEFNRRTTYFDGYMPYCRTCEKAKRKQWPSHETSYRSTQRRARYAQGYRNV